jgi:hypothetical protein
MKLKLSTIAAAILATVITQTATAADTPPAIVNHVGMCDASAAVPVGPSLFVVANDEDNFLRVYKRDESGDAIYSKDISAVLNIDPKNNSETDIEGATLIGRRIYWITSHGTNKKGEQSPSRHRLFATDIETYSNTVNLKPVGTSFLDLIEALENSTDLKDYHLGQAAGKSPKAENGLSIEGLTKTPEGSLLIGFRNPIPNKKALLVPLENQQAVIDGKEKPKLGKPIQLDLGGLGIRSIEYSDAKKAYFIIAGPYDNNDGFQLYQWSGKPTEAPGLINGVDLQGLHPETLVVYPEEKTRIQILSDDGAEKTNGKKCKKLATKDQSFRSIWVSLP